MTYAWAMFTFIERPLGRLRHKLHREPAPDPTAPDEEQPRSDSSIKREMA